VRTWDRQDGQWTSPVVRNRENAGESFVVAVEIWDRGLQAVGAAWLRGVSKCDKYKLKKFHCDYIRVSKGAPRTYQKSRRRVKK